MALDGAALGDAIANAIIAQDSGMTADQKAQLKTTWEAVGEAIVTYLTANASIEPGSFSVTTAPGAVSGTGTLS